MMLLFSLLIFNLKLIESQNNIIQGIFEIYEQTKNKEEFIENITILYNQEYKCCYLF